MKTKRIENEMRKLEVKIDYYLTIYLGLLRLWGP